MVGMIICVLGIISLRKDGSAQGTVQIDSFYSQSLDEYRHFSIYLPEGYDEQSPETYPVVYFLHGFGADHTDYEGMYDDLDELMSSGGILKLIVVKPDGGCEPYTGSFYTNSILNGTFEDYIVHDLIEYIDDQYRTKPFGEFRAVSGHSMGGYGTMKLAMKNPHIFSSLSAHSAPLDLQNFDTAFFPQLVLWENGGGEFDPDNGNVTHMMFAMAAAFSPNLENDPYYVDLPIDSQGEIVDSVFQKWLEHDPYTMIDEYIPELHGLNIYFDCGLWDELLLYSHSVDFSARLTELDIEHTFVTFLGDHTTQIYRRLKDSFPFHSDHFENAAPCDFGDVNRDGTTNVLDALRAVNIILENGDPSTEYELWAADVNEDEAVNVLDVVMIVNMILEG
jgi:S-formylglutathione hydrolase FrmB